LPITIEESDEQPVKAFLPRAVVMELGSSIEWRDEQSAKANSAIIVTESGIARLTRGGHP